MRLVAPFNIMVSTLGEPDSTFNSDRKERTGTCSVVVLLLMLVPILSVVATGALSLENNRLGDTPTADLLKKATFGHAEPLINMTNDSRLDLLEKEVNASSCCPELAAASRFAMSYGLPPIRMAMIQLVGKWKTENETRLAESVFAQNEQICQNLGIDATPVRNSTKHNETRSPAFWKMNAIHETCSTGLYDVVWFMDGDIILTERIIPVHALWSYHLSFNPSLDILFQFDLNGINSGCMLVNCRSVTAMTFLEEWDKGAERISALNPYLHEQVFVYYALRQGWWWIAEVENKKKWLNDATLRETFGESIRWNNEQLLVNTSSHVWSSAALRQRLIGADSTCALGSFSRTFRRRGNKWREGDVAIHFAGVRGEQKSEQMQEFMQEHHMSTDESSLWSGLEAAAAYLERPPINHTLAHIFQQEDFTVKFSSQMLP